ncbi:DUF1365 domain-containing protein [Henriciella pelagia]|uniref:DUF1365 domain-containing protein n=1 Tax=Henriciella pelagia TaxID=1977912 RepID=A0ABQ1J6G1_9PROT|nr:DUF1365 domain-containing protein [Henriciella pelagia]
MRLDYPLKLHYGKTRHRRFAPFQSSFIYKVFMIEIDIDRLDEVHKQCSLFSVDKANLFAFRQRDHGACGAVPLRDWAENELLKAGVVADRLNIKLVTFPRHTGYKFAPISLWVASDGNTPVGIIYEVRNTFGERHCYTAALNGSWSRHAAPKSFHVSPFFDVSGTYEFSLQVTERGIRLGVTTTKDGKPQHMASLATRAQSATDSKLLTAAIIRPFSTLGVNLAIHWEALKLWLKGAKYHPKPQLSKQKTTVASKDGPEGRKRAA